MTLTRTIKTAVRRFINWNKSLCNGLEWRLPRAFTRSLFHLHELTAAEAMLERDGQTVVDVGGGQFCALSQYRDPESGTTIIAIDILLEQIAWNRSVDFGIVADVGRSIPLRDSSVDLIVTRSVLEHLEDNRSFFDECRRVLRQGGKSIHVFPGRFAPFALVNQLIPHSWAERFLDAFIRESRGHSGFPAHYHDCYDRAMRRRNLSAGLVPVTLHYRYYQAVYVKFFVPFYLMMVAYDLLLYCFDVRPLAAQILLVAEKQ